MHRVELTDKVPFFLIPNKLHLTWENPGPVDIDITGWNQEQIKWLSNAKMNGSVHVKNLNPEIPFMPQVSQPAPQSSPDNSSIQDKFLAIKKEVTNAAHKLLRKQLKTILIAIEESNDIVQLKVLLDLEATGANRDKVLEPLNKKIQKMSSKLSSSLGPDLDSSAFAKEANLPDVEDSDIESITIKTGVDNE